MADSYLDFLVSLVERGFSKLDDLFESEPPVSIGTFLDDNAGLLSLVGIFSVVAAALPQFLSVDSREFALGAVGALITLLVILVVLIFRLILQVTHAFAEYRLIRLSQHFLLAVGLFLLLASLVFAIWQYRPYLVEYADFYVFGIVVFALAALWLITKDRIGSIGGSSITLSGLTQLAFGGFFKQYEFSTLPLVNEPSYTITIVSSVANILLLAGIYYITIYASIRTYRRIQSIRVSRSSD